MSHHQSHVIYFNWFISTASVRDIDMWQHSTKPPHQGLYTCQLPIGLPHYMWAPHNTENNWQVEPTSAMWHYQVGATSQWTKTHGSHCLVPPQHTVTSTQAINRMIKYVALSDHAKSDLLGLNRPLINSQLNLMGLDSIAYRWGPFVRFMSV
jgi:hypothetical protein